MSDAALNKAVDHHRPQAALLVARSRNPLEYCWEKMRRANGAAHHLLQARDCDQRDNPRFSCTGLAKVVRGQLIKPPQQ